MTISINRRILRIARSSRRRRQHNLCRRAARDVAEATPAPPARPHDTASRHLGLPRLLRRARRRGRPGGAIDAVAKLADESHYGLAVLACRHCGQHCAKVFIEFIDWSAGDDAQYW